MSEYVDGELPSRQQARLAAHEELCPDCHRIVRTLRGMIASLRGTPTPVAAPDPDEVAERISAGLADPRQERI